MKGSIREARYRLAKRLISQRRLLLARRISPSLDRHGLAALLDQKPTESRLDVRGLRVALVGPGENGTSPATLSSFDIIARIGFTGPASTPTATTSRCDISLYADHHASALARMLLNEDVPHGLAMTVLRSDTHPIVAEIIRSYFPSASLDYNYLRNQLGCMPNILPQFVMWLLNQKPSVLHITHTDLFLSRRYPPGYAANKAVRSDDLGFSHYSENMWKSFSWHNPFCHFNFYQWLKTCSAVSFSDPLRSILEWTPSKYGRELLTLYPVSPKQNLGLSR